MSSLQSYRVRPCINQKETVTTPSSLGAGIHPSLEEPPAGLEAGSERTQEIPSTWAGTEEGAAAFTLVGGWLVPLGKSLA